ncbi:unnamed protein product [Psylliodes chrysocephalus]|uniref:THAP-type domain-containing protein n=1 Tax=Psylliodes chrysocephalus TaxID=3402493 RepID=A0A9P0CMK2_9CUCU|nr:unnamed protein product [Psylliodes chrysocephala]
MPNSHDHCSVYNCSSYRKKCPELSFHFFPKPNEKILVTDEQGRMQLCNRLKIWIAKLQMKNPVHKRMKICSRHFTNDDFVLKGLSNRKCLKKSAVPSKNLPVGYDRKPQANNKYLQYKKQSTAPAPLSTISTYETLAVEGLVLLSKHSFSNKSRNESINVYNSGEMVDNRKIEPIMHSGVDVIIK